MIPTAGKVEDQSDLLAASAAPQPEVALRAKLVEVKREEREVASQAFRLNAGESISKSTPSGNFTAMRIAPDKLEGGAATLSLGGPGGEDMSVSIPASELSKFGSDVVALVGTIRPEDVSNSLSNSTELATPLLSIQLSNDPSSESFLSVQELEEPILLKLSSGPVLPDAHGRMLQCSWLNEDDGKWYGTGMTRVDGGNQSSFTCATTHLTIFAGIVGELAATVKCSNAAVMSPKGLRRMVQSRDWITSPAAQFLWDLVYFHLLLILLGVCFDMRAKHREIWGDEQFLVDDAELSDPSETALEKMKTKLEELKVKVAKVHAKLKGQSRKDEDDKQQGFVEKMGQNFVIGSLLKVIAVKDHVDADDLQAAIDRVKGEQEKSPQAKDDKELADINTINFDLEAGIDQGMKSTMTTTSMTMKSTKTVKEVLGKQNIAGHFLFHRNPNLKKADQEEIQNRVIKTFEDFHKKNFLVRVGIIFVANQPWLAFSRINTRGTGSFAALVLAAHLLSSLAIGALFFSASGVQDAESDPRCNPQGFWAQAIRSAAIGFISSMVAGVPMAILLKLKLDSRKFVYIPQDDAKGRERQLKKWKALDLAAWVWGIGYCAISVLFCAAFIANVSRDASTQWFVSSGTSLAKEAVVDPIRNAFIVVLMCAAYRCRDKDLAVNAVREHFFSASNGNEDAPPAYDEKTPLTHRASQDVPVTYSYPESEDQPDFQLHLPGMPANASSSAMQQFGRLKCAQKNSMSPARANAMLKYQKEFDKRPRPALSQKAVSFGKEASDVEANSSDDDITPPYGVPVLPVSLQSCNMIRYTNGAPEESPKISYR